jgi:hypothetical protein
LLPQISGLYKCFSMCKRNSLTLISDYRLIIYNYSPLFVHSGLKKFKSQLIHGHNISLLVFFLLLNLNSHRYQREESFTALNIDIRNHHNLLESLEQYVKGDLLEGANAYHCEKCNKKVSRLLYLYVLCVQSRDSANTNFIYFGLTLPLHSRHAH